MKPHQITVLVSITGLAALLLMLNLTSPTEIGPLGVLVFFTTLYVSVFSIVSLAMIVFCRLVLKKNTLQNKDYLCAAVLSFGPVMILMARSFGAINLWTMGLILLFLILAEFLILKRA